MQSLIDGFLQFRTQVFPRERARFRALADQQHPETLLITCADSRVVPNLITQAAPGELFICRTVGNQVPVYGSVLDGVSSSIEYAVQALKVKDIIVCGHSDCGAMKAIKDPHKLADFPATAAWLKDSMRIRPQVLTEDQPEGVALSLLTERNVVAQLENLKTHPAVIAGLQAGTLAIHGWIYHIHRGDISSYSARQDCFLPLERNPEQRPMAGVA